MKMIKIVPLVLMGLFLSMQSGVASIHNDHYYNPSMTIAMESWMFDVNYLSNDEQAVEGWMFDNNWLDETNEVSPVENWMMESDYLANESQMVEDWMMDPGYLAESNDNVN